jgi:hypothetical protein
VFSKQLTRKREMRGKDLREPIAYLSARRVEADAVHDRHQIVGVDEALGILVARAAGPGARRTPVDSGMGLLVGVRKSVLERGNRICLYT